MSPIEITACPECEESIVIDDQVDKSKQIDATMKRYDTLVSPKEFEDYIKLR